MKPYTKKNALLNKSNKSISNDNSKEYELKNSNSNYNFNKLKKNESGTINIVKLNKNVSSNDIWKIKENKNREYKVIKDNNENFKTIILKLQKENDALKAENQRIKKNNHKSLNKDISYDIEHKNI